MEPINNNLTEENFLAAKNEYLKLKWAILFHQYKNSKEKKIITDRIKTLIKIWNFEEIKEENYNN